MSLNPLLNGSFAVLTGDLMGTLVNKLMVTVDDRLKGVPLLNQLGETSSLLESLLGIFLHVGVISLGCELLSRATPWMFEDPAGYSLFLLTLYATSPHLTDHIKTVNDVLLSPTKSSSPVESVIKLNLVLTDRPSWPFSLGGSHLTPLQNPLRQNMVTNPSIGEGGHGFL